MPSRSLGRQTRGSEPIQAASALGRLRTLALAHQNATLVLATDDIPVERRRHGTPVLDPLRSRGLPICAYRIL